MAESEIKSELIIASDDVLRQYIESAKNRIAFIGAGMSESVAKALAYKSELVAYIYLDNEELNYRKGYSEPKAVKLLGDSDIKVYKVPNIKINILAVDDIAIVYMPLSLAIEETADKQTATGIKTSYDVVRPIIKSFNPPEVVNNDSIQLKTDVENPVTNVESGDVQITVEELTQEEINKTEEIFKEQPIEKFDVQRKTRVYQTYIGLIEIRSTGISLSQHTIDIPKDLFELQGDERKLLQAKYPVFEDTYSLAQYERRMKDILASFKGKYSFPLSGYGRIYIKSLRQEIEQEFNVVRRQLDEIKDEIYSDIAKSFNALTNRLINILYPIIKEKGNSFIVKHKIYNEAGKNEEEKIKNYIRKRIVSIIGTPESYVNRMDVTIIYKEFDESVINDKNRMQQLLKYEPLNKLMYEKGFLSESLVIEPERIEEKSCSKRPEL